jgi:hypothetical protein
MDQRDGRGPKSDEVACFANRCAPFALDAAFPKKGVKRMSQGRKRGGQPGNRNAWKHGRRSAVLKAERQAAFLKEP